MQGVTEGLPVSSSGHLALLTGRLDPAAAKDLHLALHAGTVVSSALFVRADLLAAVRSPRRLAGLAAATAPAAVAGALAAGPVTRRLGRPGQVAALLASFGVLLAAADRFGPVRPSDPPTAAQLAAMGAAQVVALAPGVSRLGAVITAARLTGMPREQAARTAVLLGVPITAGAVLLGGTTGGPTRVERTRPAHVAGAAAAGISGFAALRVLPRLNGYAAIAAYRCMVATLVAARNRGTR